MCFKTNFSPISKYKGLQKNVSLGWSYCGLKSWNHNWITGEKRRLWTTWLMGSDGWDSSSWRGRVDTADRDTNTYRDCSPKPFPDRLLTDRLLISDRRLLSVCRFAVRGPAVERCLATDAGPRRKTGHSDSTIFGFIGLSLLCIYFFTSEVISLWSLKMCAVDHF